MRWETVGFFVCLFVCVVGFLGAFLLLLFYLSFLQSVNRNFPLQTHTIGFLCRRNLTLCMEVYQNQYY